MVEKVRYRELLRRIHLYDPEFLPPHVVEAIRPLSASNNHLWQPGPGQSGSIVFLLHMSSDGVSPFKTNASSVRCVMASVEGLHNPVTNKTIKLPNSPPFLVGVYKGEQKSDDVVLLPAVEELEYLTYNGPPQDGRQIFIQTTAWIADAPERSAVLGTINAGGTVSCPRCTQEGTVATSEWQKENLGGKKKKNFMYFPRYKNLTPRLDSHWEKYKEILGNEVGSPVYIRTYVSSCISKNVTDFYLSMGAFIWPTSDHL